MDKFKIALIAFLVAIVALTSVAVYKRIKSDTIEVRAEDTPTPPPYGMWIRANLIEKPDAYKVVPEDVDKWTRTALENLNKWVHVDVQSKCWVWQYNAYYVKYQEQYYHIDLIFVD